MVFAITVGLAVLVAITITDHGDRGPFTMGTFRTDNLIVNDLTTFGGSGVANFPTTGCASGSALQAIGSDGKGTCVAGLNVPLSSGSISVGVGSAVSPINLSTLGTIDWISATWSGGTSTRIAPCPISTSNICHSKLAGEGRLVSPGVDAIGIFFSGGSVAGLWQFTSTGSDDLANSALSSPTVVTGSSTGATGMGFRFYLPSTGNNVQRVARVYTYQYDSVMTCTATALDGTATGSAGVLNTGSGGIVSENVWTVTYKVNTYSFVQFVCILTATNTGAGNPAIGWAAVSIGSV